MTEHNVCRVRITDIPRTPEITSNTPETAVTFKSGGRPSRFVTQLEPIQASGSRPYEPGQPTHRWVRMLEMPGNAFRASQLEARARERAAELFPVEQVQLARILVPAQFAATQAAPATGPVLLTILRQQRRIEDGPNGGEWPDHRTAGNALYLPDNEAAAAAVKDALAKSQTSIAARILEVFR